MTAARELRENHEYYVGEEQTIWELLTKEQRATVLWWLGEAPNEAVFRKARIDGSVLFGADMPSGSSP